jgi:putative oxidoreductase
MKIFFRTLPVSLLILLFVYAAISKLADLPGFRSQLHNQTFPREAADILLYLLPAAELLAVLLMFLPRTAHKGLLLSLLLLSLFTGYISLVLLHFWDRVPCSCGGILNQMGWGTHLLFNLFFLLLNLLAIHLHSAEKRNREPG